jgi:ABC-type iron transport system FetAB permease component
MYVHTYIQLQTVPFVYRKVSTENDFFTLAVIYFEALLIFATASSRKRQKNSQYVRVQELTKITIKQACRANLHISQQPKE